MPGSTREGIMDKNNARRDFFKYVGISSLSLTTIGYAAAASKDEPKVKPHYGMIFDQNKCVGCGECEKACRTTNDVPHEQARLFVQDKTNPQTPHEKRFVRVSCQQCEDAPCVMVCPSKACHKDEKTGIVTMTAEDCIACKYCIVACPYDVRFINERTKSAENCNFCANTNFAQGKSPACVESCKYKALIFGDLNDPNAYINQMLLVKDAVRMKPEFGTKPSLRYIPVVKVGV